MSHSDRTMQSPGFRALSRALDGADPEAQQPDRQDFGPGDKIDETLSDALGSCAEQALMLYRARRRRDRAFGDDADLFGEPAWDILLDLLQAEASASAISITTAAHAASVPLSTGLRMIAVLEERGMIARSNDPLDRRRAYLRLTGKGRIAMVSALSQKR